MGRHVAPAIQLIPDPEKGFLLAVLIQRRPRGHETVLVGKSWKDPLIKWRSSRNYVLGVNGQTHFPDTAEPYVGYNAPFRVEGEGYHLQPAGRKVAGRREILTSSLSKILSIKR